MKRRIGLLTLGIAILVLSWAGPIVAQCPEPWVDVLGANTAPDGSGDFDYLGSPGLVHVHLLLWGMTAKSLCAWEANIEITGSALVINVDIPCPHVTMCVPPDYCVGALQPLLPTGDVVYLADIVCLTLDLSPSEFFLHPVDEDIAVCLSYSGCNEGARDAGWTSGSELEPVFGFYHGEPIGSERISWSGLKGLYR